MSPLIILPLPHTHLYLPTRCVLALTKQQITTTIGLKLRASYMINNIAGLEIKAVKFKIIIQNIKMVFVKLGVPYHSCISNQKADTSFTTLGYGKSPNYLRKNSCGGDTHNLTY